MVISEAGTSGGQARLKALRAELAQVASRDYGRLLGRWRRLSRQRQADAGALETLARDVATSRAWCAARAASVPAIALDEALPISARGEEIVAAIREHQVLVVAGETGSGKTTQLPKLCLAAGRGVAGLIGCTQPRRLAARAMARRVAAEIGTEVGELVGFQVRFAEQVGEHSLVKFMTDGILLAETQRDRWLGAYDTLIIDEAHERSLNIDFLLGYLKQLARKRPALKIIITSATIDTARFAAHFDEAPVIAVEGRAYPVELRYRPLDTERAGSSLQQGSAEHIALALDELAREDPRGDVLVFLPGEREIRDAHRVLEGRRYRHTEIMPLYARLSNKEQDRVFNPGPARRVVLATNIAETSLTVPRIRYVIDTGTARVMRYSQRSQLERLHVEPVSQAAADQRKGRCGRVGPGVCVRLYGEEDYLARPRFTDPELLRASLANVILRMLDLGLGDVARFPFLDAPEPRAIADGYRRLAEVQAVDAEQRLTAIGRRLARVPIDVQLARMLVEAEALAVVDPVRVIVAFLSVQDPRERPPEARGQADAAHKVFADPQSDFIGILNLWQAYSEAHRDLSQRRLREWCQKHFLSYLRMREWRELHRQLRLLEGRGAQAAAQPTVPAAGGAARGDAGEAIHRALLSGLPTQVARKDEDGVFRGTRQRRFRVFPGSALAKSPPNWLFAAQILDLGGRVWGMLCARVEPRWIEQQAAHLLRHTLHDPYWSRQRGQVVADEQVSLFGLVLVERRTVTFHKQDLALAHAIFLEQALASCEIDTRADFVAANRHVLEQAHEREAQERRQDLLRASEERAAFFAAKLPQTITSRRALEAWWRKAPPAAREAFYWTLEDVLERGPEHASADFPATLELAGQRLALSYRFEPGDAADGVTLALPLVLLNAIPDARCEWLVPGLLEDKVVALIRSLPKKLRRNFVPAPDFARAFRAAEAPRDAPLAAVLAAFLARTTGVEVGAEAFAEAKPPPHLAMRFRVLAEDGAELAAARDLAALRERWSGKARQAFARTADRRLPSEPAARWAFGALPERIDSGRGLDAWPALVPMGEAVAVRVFERQDEAAREHHRGIEQLLRLGMAQARKRARRQLPIASDIGLQAVGLVAVATLREDLVEGAMRDALASADLAVRDEPAFAALQARLEKGLFAAAMDRLGRVEAIITAHAALRPWLEPPLIGFAAASYADLREQLEALLPAGFARDLAQPRLRELPRYLDAMRLRAERLRQDPAKDQQRMLEVLPYWRAYRELGAAGVDGPALEELRWLIEEYRVSQFAQQLGTRARVSAKRMLKALQQARRLDDR